MRTRTLTSRWYGVTGTVNPDADVRVFRPDGPVSGDTADMNRLTGEYRASWDAGLGLATVRELLVRGTLRPRGGATGPDAVAERTVRLALPASDEDFVYDEAGRLKEDSLWFYTWDAMNRLRHLSCKVGSLSEPGGESEEIDFTYDAEGRRTQKLRTVVYSDHRRPVKVESSRVLYSGWPARDGAAHGVCEP
jgi:hypothetical protein